MKDGYRQLGDYIRPVDLRNTDGQETKVYSINSQYSWN